jgi:pimeloyl-ACP methyl ester carboxylesterase
MFRSKLAAALCAVVPFCAAGACTPGQAVHDSGYVPIGGIPQWLTVDGADCANPVVLVLHGGPGNALSPFGRKIYGGWEQDFTVVQWDQRGAGMTYGAQGPAAMEETLSIERMRDDGIAVAEYLSRKLNKPKLILLAGSWSSILGVHMIKARPDLFLAYVGSAQIVSYEENSRTAYSKLAAMARQMGDQEALRLLEGIGVPPWSNPRNGGVMRRIVRKYEALSSEAAPAGWWVPAAGYAAAEAVRHYEDGEDYSYLQFVGMKGNGMYSRVDLPKLGTAFAVPFYLFQGESDLLTLPEPAKRYFDSIVAPDKQFLLLAGVGHDPNQKLVDAQFRLLRERFRRSAAQGPARY